MPAALTRAAHELQGPNRASGLPKPAGTLAILPEAPSLRGLRRTSPAASVLNSIAEPHAIPREAKMTGRSESIFSWLSVLGAAVPPRDPNDDEEDEEDGGDEDDDREPAVIREPDED